MDACPLFPDHLLLSTHSLLTEADIISIQPASSPPVASHKGALGALVVNLYPHGTCWSPWHLSPSGWPQSRYGSHYDASKSESAGIVRHWQAATTSRHAVAFENKGNLPENELKVSPVRSYLLERVWSLSRSGSLLIVKPFSWEIHLMELKSFPELTWKRPL